jgi:hypothetical protein
MAIRHRVPTIFSIYMVDVLCCALGCVILLWQVSFQEAEQQTAEAKKQTQEVMKQTLAAELRGNQLQESLDKLKNARLSISSLTSEIDSLKVALDASQKKEVQVTLMLDDKRKALDAAEQLALVRKKEYEALKETHALALAALEKFRGANKDLEAKTNLAALELTEKLKANAALLLKIAAAEGRVKDLEKDLDDKTASLLLTGKKLDDRSLKLSEVERLANLLGKEKLELLAKLKTADLRVRIMESDLTRLLGESAETQKRMAELLKDKDALNARLSLSAKDLEKIRTASENRFAGITLTGKKVVFMVDMSGSMELTDLKTEDPDKWPFLCETIARILLSLLDVTHYQVILFSDRVSYPLANDGRWFEVKDKAKDAKAVADQLKAVKPKGPTNMYAAFEETFRFRAMGMDTIYVFSDGLPNDGPKVVVDLRKAELQKQPDGKGSTLPNRQLTEQEITEAHAKYLRTKLKDDWNKTSPRAPKVRINTIGFFYESPDVGAFLWALAREHDGSFVGMNKR